MYRKADVQTCIQTHIHSDGQTGRHVRRQGQGRKEGRKIERETDRMTGIQTDFEYSPALYCSADIQADRQEGRKVGGQEDRKEKGG